VHEIPKDTLEMKKKRKREDEQRHTTVLRELLEDGLSRFKALFILAILIHALRMNE